MKLGARLHIGADSRPPRVARRQLTAAAPALTLEARRRAGGEVADPARGSLLANLTPRDAPATLRSLAAHSPI